MRKYTVTSRDRSPSGAPEAARGRLGHRWIFEAAELPGRNDHLCLTGWCFRSAMMRTAARPGQAVARSPEVDWARPRPTTAPPKPAAKCIRSRCGTASADRPSQTMSPVPPACSGAPGGMFHSAGESGGLGAEPVTVYINTNVVGTHSRPGAGRPRSASRMVTGVSRTALYSFMSTRGLRPTP